MAVTNTTTPACVGIIMDGNRRFARREELPLLEGHRAGLEKLKEVVRWAQEAGVENLVLFAFSTENWNRKKEEVEYLLALFEQAFDKEFEELKERNARVRFIGDRSKFSESLQKKMQQLEEETATNTAGTVAFAVSYGGRAELVHATNQLLAAGKKRVSEEDISRSVWTHDIPDPDIVVRTGGEKRLSGFLAWQSVYSELFFIDTLWPEFSKEEFNGVLEEFARRERRHGK